MLRIRLDAKVVDATLNGSWRLPAARSEEAEILQIKLTSIAPPTDDRGSDIYLWCNGGDTFKDMFSSKYTWMHLRNPSPTVSWHKLIWFSEAIPRCSFITWLVLLARLPTRDRLLRWGMSVQGGCVLCSAGLESHDHLFFVCPFSSVIWSHFASTLWSRFASTLWSNPPSDFPSLTAPILALSSPIACIAKLWFQVIIYLIWKERNARIFTGTFSTTSSIISAVDRMLRDRLLSIPTRSPTSPSFLETYFLCTRDLG